MKVVAEICIDPENENKVYKLRRTARAIVLDDRGKVALINETLAGFHLLPGGGIDAGETIIGALHREVLEEVGAKIEVIGEVGMTIEQRNFEQYILISYCYLTRVLGELHDVCFTDSEKSVNAMVEWHNLEEAIRIFESQMKRKFTKEWLKLNPKFDEIEFQKYKSSIVRELALLKEYKNK